MKELKMMFFPFKFECISVGQAVICSHGSANTRTQLYDNVITVERNDTSTQARQKERERGREQERER